MWPIHLHLPSRVHHWKKSRKKVPPAFSRLHATDGCIPFVAISIPNALPSLRVLYICAFELLQCHISGLKCGLVEIYSGHRLLIPFLFKINKKTFPGDIPDLLLLFECKLHP